MAGYPPIASGPDANTQRFAVDSFHRCGYDYADQPGPGVRVPAAGHEDRGDVYRRSRAMLRLAERRGGYALGSGNSIPDYVPDEGFLAMVWAALEARQARKGEPA